MLLKIRGGLDSIFVTVLLGILIAAFAIWGVGTGGGGVGSGYVAVVGDEEIPAQQFANRVQNQAQQYQIQFGGAMSTNQIIHGMGLIPNTLQQMIGTAAFDNETARLGMRASDDLVATEIATIPAFLLPDGSFSPQMFEQVLSSNGLTPKQGEDSIRKDITRQQLFEALAKVSPVPRNLIEVLHTVDAERRRANMITIKASEIVDIPEADDTTLSAYYEDNKSAYMTPLRRTYNYIYLTPERFKEQVELSEDDILQAYENNIGDWQKPELRNLSQAIFPDLEAARSFVNDIHAGADFATEAVARTEFTAEELGLGDLTYEDLETDYDAATAEAVFALEAGKITAPLEGLAGFSVFMVNDITEGNEKALDEVRGDIVTLLTGERAIDLMFDFLPDLEDALSEEGTLTPVADKLALPLATVSAVDGQGRNADGKLVITQQEEAQLLRAAFTADVGQEPELTDIDPTDNTKGVYLLEVTEEMQPQAQAYEDVKSAVRRAWQAGERQRKAGELADQALLRIKAGEDTETIAADLGGTSFDAKNITRRDSGNSGLSNNIRALIFSLGVGQVDMDQSADGDGYVIARVTDIMPGDPKTQTKAVQDLQNALAQAQGNSILTQYQRYLLDQNRPEINSVLIDQIFPRDSE